MLEIWAGVSSYLTKIRKKSRRYSNVSRPLVISAKKQALRSLWQGIPSSELSAAKRIKNNTKYCITDN